MDQVAKDLLDLPDAQAVKKPKKIVLRCLVFFTSDKTVGIVPITAVANSQSGVIPSEVEEGVLYPKVRFQGKQYEAKVLKISGM